MAGLLEMVGSSTFWVLVSFVVFIALVGRKAGRFALTRVDRRTEQISTDIANARQVRDDAEDLHRDQAKALAAAEQDAETIRARGKATAAFIREDARTQLQALLQRSA